MDVCVSWHTNRLFAGMTVVIIIITIFIVIFVWPICLSMAINLEDMGHSLLHLSFHDIAGGVVYSFIMFT